ncbi:putative U6 snRNA phosphodiesterase [Hypsibius exemplaris]|uniref:U6 snRNA phosphodiesterase 1 n=1 Tax=Hypsibius exemplaris TaxID=2072580 RepID=A0A1W0WQ15_HYPEX|nr:putative U6 snRNA phosphodiesterase [Hypsibius exemplaris]
MNIFNYFSPSFQNVCFHKIFPVSLKTLRSSTGSCTTTQMPIGSRVRDVLRRLIDDYGSSDEEKEKTPALSRSKKPVKLKDKIKKRDKKSACPPGTLKSQDSLDHQSSASPSSSSSSTTTGSEDDPPPQHEEVEEHPIYMSGLLGGDASIPADGSSCISLPGSLRSSHLEESERVRAFPHFPGNWATFVYMIPRTDGLTSLFNQLIHETAAIPQLRPIKWSLIEEPHISLSRTVALRYHEIPHFTARLKADIMKTSLPRFCYSLEDIAFFKNDHVNTSFLALKVRRGQEEMANLLKTVNTCLKSFNMPPFYENPEFHVSFAWSMDRVSDEDKRVLIDYLQSKFDKLKGEFSEDLEQNARAVHCKSGNRTYLIPL